MTIPTDAKATEPRIEYGPWEVHGFCKCGWHARASFGSMWHVVQTYPACPECGERYHGIQYGRAAKEYKPGVVRNVITITPRKWWFDKRTVTQEIKP